MFPIKKSYLRGLIFQCHRTRKDSKTVLHDLRKKHPDILCGPEFYILQGVKTTVPQLPPDVWDVLKCTASNYASFDGERIPYKDIINYDHAAGTFETDAGFYTYTLFFMPE